jgi:hypothetical protein
MKRYKPSPHATPLSQQIYDVCFDQIRTTTLEAMAEEDTITDVDAGSAILSALSALLLAFGRISGLPDDVILEGFQGQMKRHPAERLQ